MTVDPTDPDTFDPLRPDDQSTESASESVSEPTEIGTETPEDDAAEQRAALLADDEDTDEPLDIDPAAADEGDAAEQARTVTLDEDEYR
jgi:hypothetical protein